jgi:hypothetical protein
VETVSLFFFQCHAYVRTMQLWIFLCAATPYAFFQNLDYMTSLLLDAASPPPPHISRTPFSLFRVFPPFFFVVLSFRLFSSPFLVIDRLIHTRTSAVTLFFVLSRFFAMYVCLCVSNRICTFRIVFYKPFSLHIGICGCFSSPFFLFV